jgi:hypothetical protein
VDFVQPNLSRLLVSFLCDELVYVVVSVHRPRYCISMFVCLSTNVNRPAIIWSDRFHFENVDPTRLVYCTLRVMIVCTVVVVNECVIEAKQM